MLRAKTCRQKLRLLGGTLQRALVVEPKRVEDRVCHRATVLERRVEPRSLQSCLHLRLVRYEIQRRHVEAVENAEDHVKRLVRQVFLVDVDDTQKHCVVRNLVGRYDLERPRGADLFASSALLGCRLFGQAILDTDTLAELVVVEKRGSLLDHRIHRDSQRGIKAGMIFTHRPRVRVDLVAVLVDLLLRPDA